MNHAVWAISLVIILLSGCAAPVASEDLRTLRSRALEGLKRGTSYADLTTVRAQAVEALQEAAPRDGLPWIRKGLADASAPVRFAACTALGMLRDQVSQPLIEKSLGDADANVRVAAIFALHRMGQVGRSGQFPEYLLDHQDVTVRRNTAMLLGRLGEQGAVKLLARVMSTTDAGLRIEALEAMARLGSAEAVQELKFMAHSGGGADETLALLALGETRDPKLADLFRFKLNGAKHLETRLAAAKALGQLGHAEGYEVALAGLRFSSPATEATDDPPANQLMRVKQLAAGALAAIGRESAVPALGEVMTRDADPRVQLAAAKAILELAPTEGRVASIRSPAASR